MIIKLDELENKVRQGVYKLGYEGDDARIIAEVLMYAQMRGNNQGITIIATEPYNPSTTLIAAFMPDLIKAQEVVLELRKLSKIPCAIEVVDDDLLNFIDQQNPNQLREIIQPPFPKLVMLIEFDDASATIQKKDG